MKIADKFMFSLEDHLSYFTSEEQLQVLRALKVRLENKMDKFWLDEANRILGVKNENISQSC